MSEIEFHDEDGQAALTLRGVIEGPHLSELLAASVAACGSGKPVLLNWSEAERLHTGALQVLLALRHELAVLGRPLTVSALPSAVHDGIEAAGLADAFSPESVQKEQALCTGL
jgi:anti-anti-sigma regulatory factor